MAKIQVSKFIYNAVVVVLLAGGIYYVCSRFVHLGNVEYTDDAQIEQLMTPVNSRVQGFINKVCFEDYQYVHEGDTLAIIEDAQYRLALAQAEAGVSAAKAGQVVTATGANTAETNIETNDAAIAELKVQLDHAKNEYDRYQALLDKEAVTRQEFDRIATTYKSLQAKMAQLQSVRRTSSSAHTEQTQRIQQSQTGVDLAQAQVNMAQLNLSYCVVTSPCSGYVGKKDIQEGQLIQPGQKLATVISQDDIWIIANYRETQLCNIKEGAEVEITVDAIKDVKFKGKVDCISHGSQASYSMVPSGNSAGNFVKVEQRVPVRIVFSDDNKKEDLEQLRCGLNVECEVKF